jgi:serine/threonine-protein kinase
MDELKNILRTFLKANNLNCSLGEISNLKQIGEGGNGVVFSGELQGLEIAVKFLVNPTKSKLTRFKAEYLNVLILPESKLIAKPLLYEEYNIDEKQFPAIIMKKYDNHYVRPETPTLAGLKNLCRFLTTALDFIHSQGIIHRDLKPDNILVADNELVLSDFGIASYNPEVFKLRAETKQGERIANRLFSAPEQEEANTQAHPTMDIYALGQILHWYATDTTHRGTDRTQISTIIENSEIYDFIIEKCLAQNPKNRFQSIKQLRDEANKVLNRPKQPKLVVNSMDYLVPFGMALGASFPKGISRANYSDDKKIIDRLITNIAKNCSWKQYFWWLDADDAASTCNFLKIDDETWLMGETAGGEEIRIKSVWVFHDVSYHADTVLLNLAAMPPFGIYEDNTLKKWEELTKEEELKNNSNFYRTVIPWEEAALVDNKFYVSRAEFDNGFAEVDDEVINLSEHEVSIRTRHLKEKSILIGTHFNSFWHRENNKTCRNFLKKHNGGEGITERIFLDFVWEIRRRKYEDVYE